MIRPILRHQTPRTLLRYVAEVAGMPVRLESLLDASPLRRTVSDWLDWELVRTNLEAGHVDALAVVATSASTERAVVFVQARENTPVPDVTLVDYVLGPLGDEHVLASAAIPVFFRSVRVGREPDADWFFDGGMRLNTPIKPALDLGVDRVVVVATTPRSAVPSRRRPAAQGRARTSPTARLDSYEWFRPNGWTAICCPPPGRNPRNRPI